MLKQTLTALSLSLVAAASYAGTPAPLAKNPTSPVIEQESISYSNFSLGYAYASADLLGLVDAHSNGIQAALEYSPVNHVYLALRGGWSDVDVDVVNLNFDYWTGSLGVGGYISLTRNIDFVTEVGADYANISLSGAGLSTDDWGVYVTPHFRAKFGALETHLGVTYTSNDLAISEWSAFARLFVEVAPKVDLYVGGNVGFGNEGAFENAWGLQAGVRLKF